MRSSLQRTTDKRKDRREEDTIDTPDSVCDPASSESTYDSTEVVDGDDAALMRGVCDGSVCEAYADFCYVVGTGVYLVLVLDVEKDVKGNGTYASHYSLIIAFEEDGNQTECLDED